jgi:hypothetical protein
MSPPVKGFTREPCPGAAQPLNQADVLALWDTGLFPKFFPCICPLSAQSQSGIWSIGWWQTLTNQYA